MKKVALVLGLAGTVALTGCTGAKKDTCNVNNDDLYIVYKNDRVYAFDDTKVMAGLMEHNEVAYFQSYIGAVEGKTLVMGLSKTDSKQPMASGVYNMIKGHIVGREGFKGFIMAADGTKTEFTSYYDMVKASNGVIDAPKWYMKKHEPKKDAKY
jgi:hypothetical protein